MQNNSYILISGATSDIGREIAKTLSPNYPLLLHGRNAETLETLKKELNPSNPIALWCADLTDIYNVKSSLKELLMAKQLCVEGFVHCAGTLKILPFKTFREDYIKEIFDVNLFSAIAILQVLLMKNNLSALKRVLFISALSSKRGDKGNTMYASSKGALDALAKSLAIELAPNINVNAILPGNIKTKMTENMYNDIEKRATLESQYPIGHGQCRDIALMVQFLLGEGGRWITAQNYFVDGGASMFL